MFNAKLFLFTFIIIIFAGLTHLHKGKLFALLTPTDKQLSTQISKQAGKASFPMLLNDPSGMKFQLDRPAQRILSATLASDHILADLINVKRIVAVTQYVDYPSMSNVLNTYPDKIPRTQGEIESMLALRPDLIIIASYSNPDTVRYLLSSGIAVVRLKGVKSFADIIHNIELLGNVTGSQIQARKVIEDLTSRINHLQQQVHGLNRPRVLYYDLNGYSVGGNSLMNESIKIAGGINAAQSILPDGEHKISEEVAISLQPDVIVMNKWVFNQNRDQQSPLQILKNKKAWENVPAVKNKRVYGLPGTWLRSVSQHRVLGVEAMLPLLHPELSTTKNQINEVINGQSAL